MDLLSVSKIFGGISNPVKLFKIIFNEETIPELYSFYSHWEGENALDSQSRAIRRMVISPPKSLTQGIIGKSVCLCRYDSRGKRMLK